MGDRANVCVITPRHDPIFLYCHWGGTYLPHTVADALRRGADRWDDYPYLARIIFSEMIKDDVMETTGYGISTEILDNEYPIVVVDSADNSIGFCYENVMRRVERPIIGDCFVKWFIPEYLALDKKTIDKHYLGDSYDGS